MVHVYFDMRISSATKIAIEYNQIGRAGFTLLSKVYTAIQIYIFFTQIGNGIFL